MADLLPVDTTSATLAGMTPLSPVAEAEAHLRLLLADPPNGHGADPQPSDWYEAVFDDLAAAHPEKCSKLKPAGGQS
ncbi:hypothetical protein ACIPY6_28435 [Streptomyces sp. NPDC090054]|uniref:hypothetical protein n=1 Tax=Streptomyces sp. NPDC090054 TaxID=3365933 RepID=UPI00380735DB